MHLLLLQQSRQLSEVRHKLVFTHLVASQADGLLSSASYLAFSCLKRTNEFYIQFQERSRPADKTVGLTNSNNNGSFTGRHYFLPCLYVELV